MRVWLITVGEPLQLGQPGARLLRAGALFGMLSKSDHQVTWWTSTFDHWSKRHHSPADVSYQVGNGADVRLLHGCGYSKNISLRRIVDHRIVARRFAELAEADLPPDIILCSLPTLELAVVATQYGKRHGVPVVIDIRDLWPDLFLEFMPRWLRPMARVAMLPMRRQARRACHDAYAITGNSPGFVEWGLHQAGRDAGPWDKYFPFGYAVETLALEERDRAESFWRSQGLSRGHNEFLLCFFGTMGQQFDLATVVDAAKLLEAEGRPARFVLCGTGESLPALQDRAKGCRSVLFPGWVGKAEIRVLMEMANVGLAPYVNHIGFASNLPNKPIEYLAGGLPILSSLRGYLEGFLEQFGCGVTYKEGSAASLRDLVAQISDNSQLAQEMAKNAKIAFKGRFEADAVYGAMIAYLEEVVAAYRAEHGQTA